MYIATTFKHVIHILLSEISASVMISV